MAKKGHIVQYWSFLISTCILFPVTARGSRKPKSLFLHLNKDIKNWLKVRQTDTNIVSIFSTFRVWRNTFILEGLLNSTLMVSLLTPITSEKVSFTFHNYDSLFLPATLTSEFSLMEPLMRSSRGIVCKAWVVSWMSHLALVAAANQRQLAEP